MKDTTHSTLRYALIGAAIAGALTAPYCAQAWEIIGTSVNAGGGEILVTDGSCGGGQGLLVITSDKGGGSSIRGCGYLLPPGRTYVNWDDGTMSVFNNAGFTLTSSPKSTARVSPAVRSEPKPASSFADRILGKDWKCQECLVTTTPSRKTP